MTRLSRTSAVVLLCVGCVVSVLAYAPAVFAGSETPEPGHITGRVYDPVAPGIAVTAYGGPQLGPWTAVATTYTAADGTFDFSGMSDKYWYVVGFEGPSSEWSSTFWAGNVGWAEPGIGAASMSEARPLAVGSSYQRYPVNVRLRGTGIVAGTVRSESGNPLQGIRIWLYGNGWNGTSEFVGAATTGADGRFSVTALPPGTYEASVLDDAKGYLSQERATVGECVNGATTTADFVLRKAVVFSGTVRRDSGGAGVPGVQVITYREDPIERTYSSIGDAWTDSMGRWRIGGLESGRYKVYFRVHDTASATEVSEYYHDAEMLDAAAPVDAPAGDSIVLDEGLVTGGAVTGACRDGLTGLRYDAVTADVYRRDETAGTWSWYSSTASSIGGVYRINRLPTGTYRVRCKAVSAWPPVRPGFYPDAVALDDAGDIHVDAGSDTRADVVAYPVEQIAGSVRSLLSGKRLDAIEVELWRGMGSGSWSLVATCSPSPYDDYAFDGLDPGTYRLTAWDTLGRYYHLAYPDGETVEQGGDIDLTRGLRLRRELALRPVLGMVRGTIRDAQTGLPVAGATVGWQSYVGYVYQGPVEPIDTVTTDASGAFEIPWEADELALRIWDEAGLYAPRDYGAVWWDRIYVKPSTETTVGLALERRGRFMMTVTDAESGEPLGGVTVSYTSRITSMGGTALTDSGGAMTTILLDPSYYWFTLSDPVGRYQTLAYDSGGGVWLGAGETTALAASMVPNHHAMKLALTSPSQARVGATVTVSGTLTKPSGEALAGRTDVTLWVSRDGGSGWSRLGVCSDAGTPGTYGAQLVLAEPLLVQMRFGGDRFFLSAASETRSVVPVRSTAITKVDGADRIATAIVASKLAFPGGASSVVIATGFNWPDALGGSALAGALDGPILLTRQDTLPPEVTAEIVRLKATRVYVLGGASAVSDAVLRALDAIYNVSVERISGANRYETANKVAAKTMALTKARGSFGGTVFVVTGAGFADALGASPLAAAKGWPIYLVNPAQPIPDELLQTLQSSSVTCVLIVGGQSAVAGATESRLKGWFGSGNVTRLAGANRYETAVKVAAYGAANAGLGYDRLAIATGENFPDALSGGVLQGKTGSVMLLTPTRTLNANVAAVLVAKRSSIFEVRFLGGPTAVSNAVRTAVQNALK